MAVPAPNSSAWTQQPRVSQQAICPPSLSRGLRWRSACWLHAVPKPPATSHRVWHFGGRRSKKFSFQKLLSAPLPHLFHVAMPDTHSVENPPDPGGRVFPMRISSQVGETCAPPLPGRGAVAAEAGGCERYRPLPWAMRWSLSVWPLCRCHSDSYGSIAAWRCCPEGRAHHLTGQGQGTSSSW